MTTSTEVTTRTPQQELAAQIRGDAFQQQVALALPEGVSAQRFARVAITAINQNPDLADPAVDRGTIFTALLRAAQDGLLPDGREAALVIFGGKAAYLPMVGGFRKIAAEHGWSIRARVVYEADEFDYEEGLDFKLSHRPARFGAERGKMVAAYAVATHKDGRRESRVMEAAAIEKRRQVSRQKDGPLWRDWTEAAWEKTVARDLFQDLPLGDPERVARVLVAEEIGPDEARRLLYGTNGNPNTPAQPVDEPAASAGDGQQAEGGGGIGDGPAREEGTAAAAPAPGDEDEPGPDTAATASPPVAVSAEARKLAESAAAVVIPSGQWAEKTIAEIAATEGGQAWFKWILRLTQPRRNEDHKEHLIFRAAEAYAAAHPELTA